MALQNLSTQNLNNGIGKNWEMISPVDSTWQETRDMVGVQISRTIQGTSIYYPTGMMRDENGDVWLSNYLTAPVVKLNAELEVDTISAITYQVPTTGDGTRGLLDCSITTDGSDLVLAVSWQYHCARVYNRTTGALISTIGIPGSNGIPTAGKLWNPHSAIRLPSGNILVSSYNGIESNSAQHGSISEWDVSTAVATLVAVHTEAGTTPYDPQVGTNKTYRPTRMVVDSDDSTKIWVSLFTQGYIVRIDTATWLIDDIITSPSGTTSIAQSYGLAESSTGDLIVSSNIAGKIYGINKTDKTLSWEVDVTNFQVPSNSLRGVMEWEPGFVAFAHWSGQAIYIAKTAPEDVQYEVPTIPPNWNLVPTNLPGELNTDTWILSADPHKLDSSVIPYSILSEV